MYTAYALAPFPAMCASVTRTEVWEEPARVPKRDSAAFEVSSGEFLSRSADARAGSKSGTDELGDSGSPFVPSSGFSKAHSSFGSYDSLPELGPPLLPFAALMSSSAASSAFRPRCAQAGEKKPNSGRNKHPTSSSLANGTSNGLVLVLAPVSHSSAAHIVSHRLDKTREACFSSTRNGDVVSVSVASFSENKPRSFSKTPAIALSVSFGVDRTYPSTPSVVTRVRFASLNFSKCVASMVGICSWHEEKESVSRS